MPRRYPYCPHCRTAFEMSIIHGNEQMVCPNCAFVFWQNPAVGVAVIVLKEHDVLLGRRARGGYQGLWCIPCGYVEYDEDVRIAAKREFLEETGLEVTLGRVYTVHSNFHAPKMHSVGIWFEGQVVGGALQAGDDLDEVAYFSLRSPPPTLAFPTDELVFADLARDMAAKA